MACRIQLYMLSWIALACSLPIALGLAPVTKADSETAPLFDAGRLKPVELPSTAGTSASTIAEIAVTAASAAGLPSADNLLLVRDRTDALGTRHVRFQQVVQYTGGPPTETVPVYGAELIVHMRDTSVYAITGNVAPDVNVQLPPTVSRAAARAAAVAQAKSRSPAFDEIRGLSGLELTVVPSADGYVLVYCSQADFTGPAHAAEPAQLRLCSDAHGAGRMLESRNVLRTAIGTGKSMYSGTVSITTNLNLTSGVYEMRDTTRSTSGSYYTNDYSPLKVKGRPTAALFTDADNTWGTGSNTLNSVDGRQTAAVDAHYGMAVAVDYYKKVHGRNGIWDDASRTSYSVVHYGKNYDNAFWDGAKMTYGDGDGRTFTAFTSLDVCGHELTHGVTESTANLDYSGESGGLNEAISDIFGTAIEHYAYYTVSLSTSPDTPDFWIGEVLYTPYKAGDALRYMDTPSRDGRSPDNWYSGIGKLDVHYSSGPANRCFYLLCQSIGMQAAEKIFYRALTTYWVSSTDYKGARAGCLLAATDLFGATSSQYTATAKAWADVNVL